MKKIEFLDIILFILDMIPQNSQNFVICKNVSNTKMDIISYSSLHLKNAYFFNVFSSPLSIDSV